MIYINYIFIIVFIIFNRTMFITYNFFRITYIIRQISINYIFIVLNSSIFINIITMVLDKLTDFFNSNNTNGSLNCNINLHNTIIESVYSINNTLFLEIKDDCSILVEDLDINLQKQLLQELQSRR